MRHNRKKWVLFGKIHIYGNTFLGKLPLDMGMGFEQWLAHPQPIQICEPALGLRSLTKKKENKQKSKKKHENRWP